MTHILLRLAQHLKSDNGVIGRIALVVLILAIIIVAAIAALIVPN